MEEVVTAVVAAMPTHESPAPAYSSNTAVPNSAIALELRATPKLVLDHYAKVIATLHKLH